MAQLYAMVVKRDFNIYKTDGSGDVEKVYKNVLKQPMQTTKYDTFPEWKAEQEAGDPSIILIQLTESEYNNYLIPENLWIDGMTDMPKWQYNETLDEIGHWDDPEDMESTWIKDEPIPDNRFRITIRHDASLQVPTGSSPFLDLIEVDQGDKTIDGDDSRVTLRFEVRNKNNVLIGSPGRTPFYNAGTPTVIYITNGIGELYIDTTEAHKRRAFYSNHTYRVDNVNRLIETIVFSKQINDN